MRISDWSSDVCSSDLRLVARRTWLFFETFVRPEDNWLPPDNYQEPPNEETAHRTSPTNIGMMLISSLTAWRLGHIGLNELEMRMRKAPATIDRQARYRGPIIHCYRSDERRAGNEGGSK